MAARDGSSIRFWSLSSTPVSSYDVLPSMPLFHLSFPFTVATLTGVCIHGITSFSPPCASIVQGACTVPTPVER